MRKNKKKKTFFNTQANNISIFSKVVIIILIAGMIISNLNLGVIVKAFEPEEYKVITEDIDRDFSGFDKIEEINSLRTSNSKTYIKENGMYETEYYGEKIHYKDNNDWKEIDNSLSLKDNNRYHNNSNKYNISFPNKLNKNNEVVLNYLNNQIKIYYNTEKEITAKLNNSIDRTKKNLKDEICYHLSSNEIIQYVIKQDSIKENIILNSYIKNYNYSYYIDTDLRIERIGNELYFYDGQTEVFVMNEYYMFDAENNTSNDIDFEIIVVDEDTYRIDVTPNDEYLETATYPVVIDPEITLIDGGILDGVTWLVSIDKQANTAQHLDIGSFTLANRSNSTTNDDKVAYLELYIPREYDKNIGDIITRNQLMYANLTLTTVSTTNANDGSKVDLKYATSFNWSSLEQLPTYNTEYVDSQYFHGTTVFNHKFDILEGITQRLENYKSEDIRLGFELSVDANANTEVTYSLGWDLGGDKPLITLGYISDAGLSDYYTYESLPISDDSNIYVSHNSGNLTFIYNDYSDGNLLKLSHIYNANRKYNNSQYGNGFSINYNEYITPFSYESRLLLTEGDGREIVYYSQNETCTEYIAGDGSGDILYKDIDNSSIYKYKIETSNGGLKLYNDQGKLKEIFVDKKQYDNSISNSELKKLIISYNNDGTISRIDDSFGNYMLLNYLTIANDPLENQVGVPYLAFVEVYKKDPTSNSIQQVDYLEFEYKNGNLLHLCKNKGTNNFTYTNLSWNSDGHIIEIEKNDYGYEFDYDIKNRLTNASIQSSKFLNGDSLLFTYDSNGKKTKITNSLGESTCYTFDDYYHTNSIETNNGYTTFYKYQDIYYDSDGLVISSPNYNMNHKIILQSNSFKNVGNPITNHGFEVIAQNGISGWTTQLTGNSTAEINSNIYLFGSKVLELDKTTSGTAKIYQEIPVENGKTYIITGYVHNENDGNGAYIEVIGNGGTINKLSSSEKVKNTENFIMYEYKFTANYTGKAKLYLINDSVGKAYFDNIQINTNYIDTRYNYLENSSFDVDSLAEWYENNEIYGWEFTNGCELVNIDSLQIENEKVFNDNCGKKYVKLYYDSSISQTIMAPGSAGDTFVFGGYCFYENYTGDVSVTLTILTENGSVSKVFTFDSNDINATYMMNKLTIEEDYLGLFIEIKNNSLTSTAAIDNFAIFKEGYAINLTYTETGNISSEINEITDTNVIYNYDSDDKLTSIITDNNEISFDYDDNNRLNTVEQENVVTTIVANNSMEEVIAKGDSEIGYYFGSTLRTDDKLYPIEETDMFGNVTTYTYDYLTGLVTKIINDKDVSAEYTYDEHGNVTSIINGKNNNKKTVMYNYDEFGRITCITIGDLKYDFVYNNYGDLKTISVNNNLLVTHKYTNEDSSTGVYTGELNESEYNYGTIYFEYDELHQISKIYKKSLNTDEEIKQKELILEYKYNDYGEIASYHDYLTNETFYYNYDNQNRLINVISSTGNSITYSYDHNSNIIEKVNGEDSYKYSYDSEGNLILSEQICDEFDINYDYYNNSLQQLACISYYYMSNEVLINYEYETITINNSNYYTGRISKVQYTLDENNIRIDYSYDSFGNILDVTKSENGIIVYSENNTYDIFNQLTEQHIMIENTYYEHLYNYDSRGNITLIYVYDMTHNVLCKEYAFTYSMIGNKDQLVSVKNNLTNETYNINYSVMGLPNYYFGWTMEYDMNNLVVMNNTDTNTSISYTYNASGYRIEKIVSNSNSITNHKYVLEDDKIIKEIVTGALNYEIDYYYDYNGDIVGFMYNNNKYLYMKNLQNDIVGIIDSNNNIVVEYYYTAYGSLLSTNDYSNQNLASINPFKYRSYYHDRETNYYYLNSRYYDANICRFITMDEVENLGFSGTILSYNLFSYCENNPITLVDYNGAQPEWAQVISKYAKGTLAYKAFVLATQKGWFSKIFYAAGFIRKGKTYHARQDCLQQYGGYNDLYDWVFDLGTSMKSLKFPFSYNGEDYIFWAWKGDYLNLGAGAELGIYYGGPYHWFVDTDLAMPMTIKVYRKNKQIVSYSAKAWWITGFNPYEQDAKASQLSAIYTIDFSCNKGMYRAFYNKYRNSSYWSFGYYKATLRF